MLLGLRVDVLRRGVNQGARRLDLHRHEPLETFESGIGKTVRWYLEHEDWVRDVTSGSYRQWMAKNYTTES